MNGKIYDPLKDQLAKAGEDYVNKTTEKIKDPVIRDAVNAAVSTAINSAIDSASEKVESKINKTSSDEKPSEELATPTSSVTETVPNNDIKEKANEAKYELAANALVDADSFIAKVFHIPVGKIFTSTSFFVIVYLLAWWANSNMGYNFNLDDLLYLYYIVIGKNVVTYGIDSVANSKRGSMPTKPTTNSAQQKI